MYHTVNCKNRNSFRENFKELALQYHTGMIILSYVIRTVPRVHTVHKTFYIADGCTVYSSQSVERSLSSREQSIYYNI